MDLLRADMELGFANVRHEMAELRGELRGEFLQLRADMFELLHEQGRRADSHFRTLLFAMLGAVLTVAAMAFGAASL